MREDRYVEEWRRLWEGDVEAIAYNGASCDPTNVDPKVLDWVKEHCARKPHFVKVIARNPARGQPGLLALSSPCIAVPAPFEKEHLRDLGRVSTLEDSAGRQRKVAFSGATKHPLWLQGWKKFAADNDLHPNQIVVFELTHDSHFRFTLFDEDGNILGPPPPQNRYRPPQHRTPENRTRNRTQDDKNATRRLRRELSYSDVENPRTRRRVISSDDDDDDDNATNPEQENALEENEEEENEHVSRDEHVVAIEVETNISPHRRWNQLVRIHRRRLSKFLLGRRAREEGCVKWRMFGP